MMDYDTHTIYVCKSGALYKIGYTKDLKARVKALSVGSPATITVFHRTDGFIDSKTARAYESFLHKRFSHRRVRGEWFALRGDDLEWLSFFELQFIREPVPDVIEASVKGYQDRYAVLNAWTKQRVRCLLTGRRGRVIDVGADAAGLSVAFNDGVYCCDPADLEVLTFDLTS